MTRNLLRGARGVGASFAVLLVGAVAVFASLNAMRARPAPLAGTASSPEELAVKVMEAMRARDIERLRSLALTRDEFRAHVWPYLPVSRPEVNMPFDFTWNLLQQQSEGFLRQSVATFENVPDLRRVEFDGKTSTYGDVTVHRESEFVIAGGSTGERRIRLLGSMVEQGGRWKVMSYVVND